MKNNQPLVSIIMNCYNSDKYLKEALDSIIAQTYQNWEIIFWDNQSTDKSAEIVKSYVDERIKYFYAPIHTTLGEARNRALKEIKGEFISFLDCDDWWKENKLQETLKYFDNDKIGLVHTNGNQFFQATNKYKKFHQKMQPIGFILEELISNYNVSLVSVIIRKKVLEGLIDYFDNRFSMIEEFDFFVRISTSWEINYCQEELCFWRAHSDSLTWSKREKIQIEYELFLDKVHKNMPNLNKIVFERIKAKIAYHVFFNSWTRGKQVSRSIIKPYLFIDKRLLFVYFLSYLGYKKYNSILKFIGKNL